MFHHGMPLSRRGLAALLLALVALLGAAPTPATAAPRARHTDGETLTLSMANGSDFTFEDTIGQLPAPKFTVIRYQPVKPTVNTDDQVTVQLDDGDSFLPNSYVPPSPDGMTFTLTVDTNSARIPVGTHTAVAKVFDPAANATILSNSVSFTIDRATPQYSCSATPYSDPISPGQSQPIQMSFTDTTPVDWQHSTYTVQFVGPITVTYPNLAPDSSDIVTVNAPSQIGRYTQICTFNGSAIFTSATSQSNKEWVLVSAKHHLGTVELFTNPTTLVANQGADLYVVFHAAAGLPAPTGYVGFTLGSSSTNVLPLTANGDLLVHLGPLPYLGGVSQITVYYMADPEYDSASFSFPLTNPPIPSGGGSSTGTPPSTQQATATVSGTPSPGATVTTQPTAGGTTTSSSSPRHTQTGNPLLFWLLGILGLLIVGGGAGTLFFLSRRARPLATVARQSPIARPTRSSWEDDWRSS